MSAAAGGEHKPPDDGGHCRCFSCPDCPHPAVLTCNACEPVAEKVARSFHLHYERLAVKHGYTTRQDSAVPWSKVPATNRALMVETVECVLHEMRSVGWLAGDAAHIGSSGGSDV